mmetsp:Transcript_5238/g.8078  ORF Transcript_5238/g.8078 Transcript_5238/m.8078 type:complete len:101 (+) Transcript_5238:73-375(+)|eukprot:jgi/Bigna1/135661/aug1.30_g10369
MKFMITYEIPQDKYLPTMSAFGAMSVEDDKKDMGPDIKLLGRYHDLAGKRGWAIVEAATLEIVSAWGLNWAGACQITCTPVLDDKSARAVLSSHPLCKKK